MAAPPTSQSTLWVSTLTNNTAPVGAGINIEVNGELEILVMRILFRCSQGASALAGAGTTITRAMALEVEGCTEAELSGVLQLGNPITCDAGSYVDPFTQEPVDICGPKATCTDLPLLAGSSSTSPACSCDAPWYPRPNFPGGGAQMSLIENQTRPYTDGCVTARRAERVSVLNDEARFHVINYYY